MRQTVSLEQYLDQMANDAATLAAAQTVLAIVAAGRQIAELTAAGPLAGDLAAVLDDTVRGDSQKALDLRSHELVLEALGTAPVAVIASEEMEGWVVNDPEGLLAVAIDPLDGSSNIETNAPVGTIFSILPAPGGATDPAAALLQKGANQIAAGFLIYGPQTALVLTFGRGTQLFTYDRRRHEFVLTGELMRIPAETGEYAINGSNYKHWEEPIRHYVDDCLSGAEGPRGMNYNTRWIASMVAEAYRILVRGGIYLYPADMRRGYAEGRLRLLYEASPVAFLIEQAGGAATDGQQRILDIVPDRLHQRVPFVFGSRREVECVAHYYAIPSGRGTRSPLFRNRNLFRA